MELFQTGIVLKPKGLRGEVKIQPVTDFPERFLRGSEYYTGRTPEVAVPRRVLAARIYQGFVYLLFEGVDSREKAGALAGEKVFVTGENLVPLSGDRAYIHELVGLEVLDENRLRIGVVSDVLKMPAHDVYEIRTEQKRVLVPAVGEFVEEIDIVRGIMVLRRFREFL